MQFADAFEQPRGLGFLQQVAAGAGTHGGEHRIVIAVNGEHQDRQLGMRLVDSAHAFYAGHAGEADVGEQNIGRVSLDGGQRYFHGIVLAGDLRGRPMRR